MTGQNGQILGQQDYDPFGNSLSQSSSMFGFTGEQSDSTGLTYLRARYYNPHTGTFLSRDPVMGEPPYAYAHNNPINLTDPSGNCPWCVAIGIGGIIGGVAGGAEYYFTHQGCDFNSQDLGKAILLGTVTGMIGAGIGFYSAFYLSEMGAGMAVANIGSSMLSAGGEQVVRNTLTGHQWSEGVVSAALISGLFAGAIVRASGGLGQIVNRKGVPYPNANVRGYGKVPFPQGNIRVTDPEPIREKFTKALKMTFRQWWYDEHGWYPTPDKYDIHHIQPLSRGGNNDFENLVPLKRGVEHRQFTDWWLNYP